MEVFAENNRRVLSMEDLSDREFMHEVKNLITLINSNFELLMERYPHTEADHHCQMIRDDIESLRNLMLQQSIRQGEQVEILRSEHELPTGLRGDILGLLFNTVIGFEAESTRRKIGVGFVATEKAKRISGCLDYNELRMKQVFVNLLKNAMEACREGDRISVEADVYKDDEEANEKDSGLLLTVRDSGYPVDEMIAEKLFEPKTTTKQNGSGLGLSLVKRFIEEQGGRVGYSSNEQETCFHLWLPVAV